MKKFSGPAKQQKLAKEICINSTVATAAKIIRIPDAKILVDFLQKHSSQIDGKIVLLVRDPRAMLESRKLIATWDGVWKRFEKLRFTLGAVWLIHELGSIPPSQLERLSHGKASFWDSFFNLSQLELSHLRGFYVTMTIIVHVIDDTRKSLKF